EIDRALFLGEPREQSRLADATPPPQRNQLGAPAPPTRLPTPPVRARGRKTPASGGPDTIGLQPNRLQPNGIGARRPGQYPASGTALRFGRASPEPDDHAYAQQRRQERGIEQRLADVELHPPDEVGDGQDPGQIDQPVNELP